MSGELTIEEARNMVADAALWPRVRDFLWDFAPSIHESWIDGIESLKVGKFESPTDGAIAAKPSNLQTLKLSNFPIYKRFILESLGVKPCFHTFPKDDWSRLLLLDGATLLEICKWLGALACADALRKVTDGKTVRELKAALPGVYPDMFGYTAYFKRLTASPLDHLTAGGVIETGRGMLAATLARLPEQLQHRFELKLPKPTNGPTDQRTNGPTVKPSNIQLLFKLRFPEAYSLCC